MKRLVTIALLAFILSLAACEPVFAGDYHFTWDEGNTGLHIPLTAVFIVDALQTVYIAQHPDEYHETNRFLPRHPSIEEAVAYFLAYFGAVTYLTLALPPEVEIMGWRVPISHTFQTFIFFDELQAVTSNYSIGIGLGVRVAL